MDSVLGSKKGAANDLLSTQLSGLSNVRNVGETGANNIYGAELNSAATYEEAVKQAVTRTLEQQRAQQALKGFSGGSSGDALLRARTLADGYQKSGGARAQAGVNLQGLLAQVRSAEATGQLGARSANSSSLGAANIDDSLARLAANNQFATTKGSSLENNAIEQMLAKLRQANAQAGILDADAAMQVGQANLDNAGNYAAVLGGDINRQLGSTGLANGIGQGNNALAATGAQAKYSDINALLSTLGFFRSGATPSNPVQPNIQPTINNGQIIGSGLSALGSAGMDWANTQSLIKALNSRNTGSSWAGQPPQITERQSPITVG